MKSITSLFAGFVLTAAMLTGCGCTNQNADMTTPGTMLPTTLAPTESTAQTTEATFSEGTDETINHGNGPLVEETTGTTDTTTESTAAGQTRNMPIR